MDSYSVPFPQTGRDLEQATTCGEDGRRFLPGAMPKTRPEFMTSKQPQQLNLVS